MPTPPSSAPRSGSSSTVCPSRPTGRRCSRRPRASPTSNSTPSAGPIPGSPHKATGTPVTLGFISEGKSSAIDNTDEIKGARAAVAYANDYLGGLGGHPITLKVCESLGQPATATDCANQMVAANVAAVVEGVEGQIDATIAPLAAAKIPFVRKELQPRGAPDRYSQVVLSPKGLLGSAAAGSRFYYLASRSPEVIFLATGSEVQIALDAREALKSKGVNARVVSVPCQEWFEEQDAAYRESVLPASVRARVSIEAGLALTWKPYLGDAGRSVSIEHFGASADYKTLYREFGITTEAAVAAAKESLAAAGA